MKKLVLFLLLTPAWALAQSDCDCHAAVGVSYVLPKGFSVEGAYFANRLNAGIGVAYTFSSTVAGKSSQNDEQLQENSLDLFAYAGYKLVQLDYFLSAFINAGYTMGNVNGAQPFVSSKLLFPSGNKAFSVEPFYIFNRGFSGRATFYLKL